MNPFFTRHAMIVPALSIAVAVACLAGCDSRNTDIKPSALPAGSPQPSLADLHDPVKMAKAADAMLPKGDQATPLARYRTIDSGHQIMFLYFSLLNLPIDYEKIATSYVAEYRQTTDSFKKKDLLTALQPRIDQEIAAAKSARYVRLDTEGSDLLSRYDFNKKAFSIPSLEDNGRFTYFYDNSAYTVINTNAADFASFSVPDEGKARLIEGYLSKNTRLKLEVLSYAQDADPSNQRVKLEVMKVRLLGPGGEILAEK